MSKAYFIVRVQVHDMEQYKHYMADSPGAIGAFGGKFLIRVARRKPLKGMMKAAVS